MFKQNKNRTLIRIIVILIASNLSMGLSFWYHKYKHKQTTRNKIQQAEMPAERRTRFFKEQLQLDDKTLDTFRTFNREYNQEAKSISFQLQELRIEMITELNNSKPDNQELSSIAQQIGNLHSELKMLTIQFYLNLKNSCSADQQKKLNQIFMTILEKNNKLKLPKSGKESHR